ncbi:MAG: FAD-dependent oxidoreductase, partial [Cyanobacteria bacterium J06639_1]
MRVAIIGAGLAGLSTAVDLVDAGHEVEMFESRPFPGGKVGSWVDDDGNHIEMGLHVFFGCYYNLFALMAKVGSLDSLLRKEHVHTFINKGGGTGALDFRFPAGAPFNGLKAFFTTSQLSALDKLQNSVALGSTSDPSCPASRRDCETSRQSSRDR